MGQLQAGATGGRAREQFDRSCDDALGWIARFRGNSACDDDHRAFALWLAADDQHRKALDLMLDLWEDLGSVRHLPFDEPIEEPANPARRRWLTGAGALAASALLATVLWPAGDTSSLQTLRTALGERREVTLEDGSRVFLNTDTRVNVSYQRGLRQLELVRGEAFFSVLPDSRRPFTVSAGDYQITAVGTAFNIRRQADEASDITVTEGVVRVSRRSGGIQPPALLQASQQLRASANGLTAARNTNPRLHTAWQQGELIAEAMPLQDVLQELSRYHDLRIVPGDREVAALTVSGVFNLDHPRSVIKALERSLNLRTEELGNRTLRLLKAEQ